MSDWGELSVRPALLERLEAMGVRTVGDIAKLSDAERLAVVEGLTTVDKNRWTMSIIPLITGKPRIRQVVCVCFAKSFAVCHRNLAWLIVKERLKRSLSPNQSNRNRLWYLNSASHNSYLLVGHHHATTNRVWC